MLCAPYRHLRRRDVGEGVHGREGEGDIKGGGHHHGVPFSNKCPIMNNRDYLLPVDNSPYNFVCTVYDCLELPFIVELGKFACVLFHLCKDSIF